MDRAVIEQKLESLRRCLARVTERCPVDAETLARDVDAQDIVTLNLPGSVQRSVDIAAHLIVSRDIPAPNATGRCSVRARVGLREE